jgi:hypothetical protein
MISARSARNSASASTDPTGQREAVDLGKECETMLREH